MKIKNEIPTERQLNAISNMCSKFKIKVSRMPETKEQAGFMITKLIELIAELKVTGYFDVEDHSMDTDRF